MNIGKKLHKELQMVGANGLVPSEFERKYYLNLGDATKIMLRWEQEKKVIRVEKGVTDYISRFALTK